MEDCLLFSFVSYCLNSALSCNAMQLSKCILWFCSHFLCTIATFIDQNYDDTNDNGYPDKEIVEEEKESVQYERCENYSLKGELTYDDIAIIMSKLNIEGLRHDGTTDDELMGQVYELLEDKTATLGELKQAFHVFDRDEDGFISAFELWSVFRRLGFNEAVKYEDCEKMISVFDLNGDGRISFHEFNHMMENAI